MKAIDIRNSEIQEMLDNWMWMYHERDKIIHNFYEPGIGETPEDWVNETHCNHIIGLGRDHDGYPEKVRAWNLKPEQYNGPPQDLIKERNYDFQPKVAEEMMRKFGESNFMTQTTLSSRIQALSALYPPTGFISWHNNANVPGYNLIFTWSETGDGYFQYVDSKGDIIKIPDKKGWQCKGGYFGSYEDEQEKLVYHSAYTDCWRITVSFVYGWTDMSIGLHNEIIEEIETEL